MNLTNEEATQLFELRKFSCDSAIIDFPPQGQYLEIELQNSTGRIKFQADLNRANTIVEKVTFQVRHKNVYSIRRLDFKGNHKNPPGPAPDEIFEGFEDYRFEKQDHVHFYVEGYNEKWALPLSALPGLDIQDMDDIYDRMWKFFKYCNVENLELKIRRTLFL